MQVGRRQGVLDGNNREHSITEVDTFASLRAKILVFCVAIKYKNCLRKKFSVIGLYQNLQILNIPCKLLLSFPFMTLHTRNHHHKAINSKI